jgi:hypothetical protein
LGVGDGDGDAANALTAPKLRSAATPAAPTVLTAIAAKGFMFVLLTKKFP